MSLSQKKSKKKEKEMKYVMGAFWEKKVKVVKVVELSQFESFGGGKVSHLKLWR
jgi:hypothetical protein